MTGLGLDITNALRSFARRPLMTLACLVTLGVGIGSATAVLSVVDGVVLKPLPYPEPDRLVRIFSRDLEAGDESENANGADYLDWKAAGTSFKDMAAFVGSSFNLAGDDFPLLIEGAVVTPDFFSTVGVNAARGRVLSPTIDTPGAEPVAVVSDGFWRTHLGGDDDAVGRRIRLSGEERTIVGVMPPGFDYPSGAQIWASARYSVPDPPLDLDVDPALNRNAEYFYVLGRLNAGTPLTTAQDEMTGIATRLATEFPDTNRGESIVLVPLKESIVSETRPTLLLLLAAAGVVLLIAVVNVANLMIARTTERRGEISLRMAIGARRGRIARQLLTESLLLAVVGGAFGAALATLGSRALLAIAPEEIPRAAEVAVDLRVLVLTALIVLGSGVLFGLAPVMHVFKDTVQGALNEGRGGVTFVGGRRLRGALVILEVALSLLLLVGTGLMIRTYLKLVEVDPGFAFDRTLVAHVALPRPKYSDEAVELSFHRQVLERLRSLPGVESASTVLTLPMHYNIRGHLGFNIEGKPTPEGMEPSAGFQLVDPEYFRTIDIPLRDGRLFTDSDGPDAPPVALVNEAFARRHWPGETAVGHRITLGDLNGEETPWTTIVGVVGDTHVMGLDTPPGPEIYRPYQQAPLPYMTLVVRTAGDPAALSSTLRAVVAEADPDQPVTGVTTLEEVLASSLDRRRFSMRLLGIFAAIATLMAAVGLYGVLSFSVAQRSHELGIRRALGAQPDDVVRLVVGEGFQLVGIGLAIGAIGTLGLTRMIMALIHGISAADPPSFLVGAAVLASVGLLASYLPARRATRVDPMTVLRSE